MNLLLTTSSHLGQRITRKIGYLLGLCISAHFLEGFRASLSKKAVWSIRNSLAGCGIDTYFAETVVLHAPSRITIGSRCAFNDYVMMLGSGGITIGDGVWVANHASIISLSHDADVEFIANNDLEMPITICDYAWIGSHAVILPGVTLGRSCIVGAGAVVTKNVPDYAIVMGVPARVVRFKSIPEDKMVRCDTD